MSANTVLHWMLDTINLDNTVHDQSDNHLNGTIEGNPQLVSDPMFGTCIELDGLNDAIILAANDLLQLNAYTVSIWVKPKYFQDWAGIVGKPGRDYNLWLNPFGAYVHHRFSVPDNSNMGADDTANNSFEWDSWAYLTITNDGSTARTYINGILMVETLFSGELQSHNSPLIVGRDLDGTTNRFYKGRLAHLRIYDAALSLSEIISDMKDDESAGSAFLKSHPIDFHFYNEDEQEVLYIDDNPLGQTMKLDIINTSRQAIVLDELGEAANENIYHLALNFRPETLDKTQLNQLRLESDDWYLTYALDATAIYLTKKDASNPLAAGESISLSLKGLNADGRRGTHGSQIELAYQNMHYSDEVLELSGSRLQHLNIVNHRGLKAIPLHVGFIKGDRVLSDGVTANSLYIRISNISSQDLSLSPQDALAPSRFIIAFDVQEENQEHEWALTSAANGDVVIADLISVENSNAVWIQPQALDGNESAVPAWELMPTASEDGSPIVIGADGALLIQLSNIIALKSLGHANIYVDYQNIPGYQDGTFVLQVEKAPLVFYQADSRTNARIGINLALPQHSLDVNGNIASRGHEFYLGRYNNERGNSGDSRALVKGDSAKLILNYNEDFRGGVEIKGPRIQLDAPTYVNAPNSRPDAGSLYIGNLRLGQDSDYTWIQSQNSQNLTINPLGNNVGIGIDKPSEKLEVKGTILTGGLRINTAYNIQGLVAGHARMGPNSRGGMQKLMVSFPQAFRKKPYVLANVRNERPSAETFTCTVSLVDKTRFEINVIRIDGANIRSGTDSISNPSTPIPINPSGNVNYLGWSQNLRIDWLAWETMQDSDL